MALPFVLFLTILLLSFGVGLLFYMERDGYQQLHQERMNQALVLAQTGLDYFTFHRIEDPAAFPQGVTVGPFEVRPDHFFEFTPDDSGGCTIRGFVRSGTKVVAERSLVLPGNHKLGGDRRSTYDPAL